MKTSGRQPQTKSAARALIIPCLVMLGLGGMGNKGCSDEELRYLLQQFPGQLALIMHRVPFKKVLANPNLDPEVRAKLEFVLDVKTYGVDRIGLMRNKNYEVYVELDRDAVVWNLTAAEALSLTPVTWTFPVVGRMPYLGFFKKEDALAKEEKLEAEGYDVYVRTAAAYSMLGIMADPLYSPLLRYREADLANLIIHEMTHSTVFVKGQMAFNENLALFVGNQGAYNYLCDRYGPDTEESKYALGSHLDDSLFSQTLMAFYKEMDEMYKSGLSDQEKEARKWELIEEHKRRFREEVMPKMKTNRYQGWPDREINNATIISRAVYFHDLSLYEKIYQATGRDLAAFIDFFEQVEKMKGVDAEQYAQEWLAQNGG